MHARLADVDAAAAARIHPNDAQRIQRALEVHAASGRPISELQTVTTRAPLAREFRCVALVPHDRSRLHIALAQRFEAMMAAGLLDEVRRLYARGDLTEGHPAIRAVGYRQLWSHLAGACTLENAVIGAIAATRQLAKRQMTWLRSMPDVRTFDPHETHSFVGIRESLIASFERG
jgi:tRNA dimethylallyltransferase